MADIPATLSRVRERIKLAETNAGRQPGSVHLLAVSKSHNSASIRAAHAAGQCDFGESYVQEARGKCAELIDLPLVWHFIGPLQSNKSKTVAENFAWVHSVDSLKLAQRLSAQRPAHLAPLNVCLQVNISGEASKSGCDPDDLADLATAVARLPNLKLRGLMTIPAPSGDPAAQRLPLQHLRQLYEQLCAAGFALDTLSMGMSDDLEAAIAEGATWVRIGTAIFGSRRP